MEQPILKILILFLLITYVTSYSQVSKEDYTLINLTLDAIENSNAKEKEQKLEILNKHKEPENYKIVVKNLNRIDTIYLKNRLTKIIDVHALNKIVFLKMILVKIPFSQKKK